MEPIRLVCRSSEEVGSFKVRSHILPMAGSGHARPPPPSPPRHVRRERSIVETISPRGDDRRLRGSEGEEERAEEGDQRRCALG